jgi:hypothetical protein
MTTSATTEASATALTLPAKLLLAAVGLESGGLSPFSVEALAVAAWRRWPKSFGLAGYPEHPNANTVISYLSGVKGLVSGRGWLRKTGPKLYTVTPAGQEEAWRLGGGPTPGQNGTAGAPVQVPPPLQAALLHMLDSTAYDLWGWRVKAKSEMTFANAVQFWALGDPMETGDALDAQLGVISTTLADLARLLAAGDAVLANGRSVSLAEITALDRLHTWLQERFQRHLALARNRRT